MSTLSLEGIQTLLAEVGVEDPLIVHDDLDVLNDLLDVYRSHLAGFIARETRCTLEVALKCLQWPSEMGDLTAVLPRLRLRDVIATDLATELAVKVNNRRASHS